MNARHPLHPTFVGMLIALPAVVLAAVGFFALRQDRLLVRQQAMDEARKLANEAVQVLLPHTLEVAAPAIPGVNGSAILPAAPDEDVIYQLASHSPGWVAWITDQQGELRYPASDSPPMPAARADPAPQDNAWQVAWDRAQTSEQGSADPAESLAAWKGLLSQPLPEAHAAEAFYRIGVLSARAGQVPDARGCFERVQREYPKALAESGMPWRLYARLHLLELPVEPAGSTDVALLDLTCAEAVVRFPLMAPALLERLSGRQSSYRARVEGWQQVFAAHERARRMAADWRQFRSPDADPGSGFTKPRWVQKTPNEPWLVLTTSNGSEICRLAMPEKPARAWADSALRELTLPPYFALSLTLAGRRLGNAENGEEFATASLSATETRPSADVSIRLAHPELLLSRHRVRACWFGALISLATGVMTIGFLAARRAFKHQQELNEMKTNFVSSVSHELRAPIASVRLMAEELTDIAASDTEKSRSYHGFIVQECRRLSALIENVLDFSRHEQGRKQYQFEPTDLRALTLATAELMRVYAAEKQITIASALPAEPLELEADGRALQQVLVNLLDNAIKHSPPGSTIKVGLETSSEVTDPLAPSHTRGRPSRWRRNRTAPEAPCVRIWVEDNGEGIPPDEQERIFERFYRPGSELRRQSQGVGLGLAIVKYVTEAHGGHVHVRSAVGQGSRFTVELPIRNERRRDSRNS